MRKIGKNSKRLHPSYVLMKTYKVFTEVRAVDEKTKKA